jgi:hypothetical protein
VTPPPATATPGPGQGPVPRLRPGGRSQPLAGSLPRRTTPPAVPSRREQGPPRPGTASRYPGIREWHDLGDDECRAAWRDLVDWVTWLHDRYELSVEERLPRCWARHPGLIEELHALKVWRQEIYRQTDDSDGSGDPPAMAGQAARYWHAELRQVLHAATTQYAAGCRAGHRDATPASAGARDDWLNRDPLTGVPAHLRTTLVAGRDCPSGSGTAPGQGAPSPGAPDADGGATRRPRTRPRVTTAEHLRDAVRAGTASTLGDLVPDVIQHDGTWWIPDPSTSTGTGRWRSVTDTALAADLDAAAARMRAADHAATHQAKPRPR